MVRRIVTGLDAAGRSCVAEDGLVAEASPGTADLWHVQPGADLGGTASARAPFPFYAGRGETLMRVVSLPPAPAGVSTPEMEAAASGFFAAAGAPECRVDVSRDPWMHRTPTLDYVVLLSGEVSLLLDDGDPLPIRPHDVVVQRGTNHSWLNTGPGPAVFLVVMIGRAITVEKAT